MTSKRVLGAVVAVVALGLVFATVALAKSEGNLGWRVNGKALVEGETASVTGDRLQTERRRSVRELRDRRQQMLHV
jgi:hypothetical protein